MELFPILTIFILIFSHILSAYDIRINGGKYLVVKNKKIAGLLISDTKWSSEKSTPKKDRNKMSLTGFVFYMGTITLVVIAILFALLPDIPCKPFRLEIEDVEFVLLTANHKIPVIFAVVTLVMEIVCFLLPFIDTLKDIKYKWVRFLAKSTLILGIIICVLGALYLLGELFAVEFR